MSQTAQTVINWALEGRDPFTRLTDAIGSDRLDASVVVELRDQLQTWLATTTRPFRMASELGI